MKIDLSIEKLTMRLFVMLTVLFITITGIFFVILADNKGTKSSDLKYEMPKEVLEIIENYVKDSTGAWGFIKAKELFKLNPLIKASDIEVGTPCEEYHFSKDKLEQSNDSSDIESLIVPYRSWFVPVRANGRYIYFFKVSNYTEEPWHISSFGAGWEDGWQKVRLANPESNELDIKMIHFGSVVLLHFPKKGKHNLKYLFGRSDSNGTYIENSANAYKTLDSSWVIIKEIKEKYKKNQESEIKLRRKNRISY
jgi:hypothetical protein